MNPSRALYVIGRKSILRMKAFFQIALCAGCLVWATGCATMTPQNKQLFGMQTGGMIGSISGSLIGDRIGGWGGSMIGSVVGGVAGSAIGAATTSPYNTTRNHGEEPMRMDERREPALFIRDIILEDENGNRSIDAGERCRLTFIICNEGHATIPQIMPELKGDRNARRIRHSEPIPIRQVKPGEQIRYRINLLANSSLKSGEAEYTITLKTGGQNGDYEETFRVPTIGKR